MIKLTRRLCEAHMARGGDCAVTAAAQLIGRPSQRPSGLCLTEQQQSPATASASLCHSQRSCLARRMWYLRHHARRIIRNTMKPMDPEFAKKWLFRVRVMYFVLGCTAFGFAYINYKKHKEILDPINELDPSPGHRLVRLKGQPGKVKVYRFGFGQSEYYEYDNEQYIEEYNQRAEKLKAELLAKTDAMKAASN